MSTRAARQEYLQAVAEFQRACRAFSEGMARVTEAPAAAADASRAEADSGWIVDALGTSRPPRRAPTQRREVDQGKKKA